MVNVVEIVQIDPLRKVKKNDLVCSLLQRSAVWPLIGLCLKLYLS